jgi:hypothetical protein
VFTAESVGIGGDDPPVLMWTGDITSVDMYASHPVKVVSHSDSATAILAGTGLVVAGPIGAAAGVVIRAAGASEWQNQVRLVIRARRGEEVWEAVVAVNGVYPNRVRDRLSPLLDSLGIPLRSSVD